MRKKRTLLAHTKLCGQINLCDYDFGLPLSSMADSRLLVKLNSYSSQIYKGIFKDTSTINLINAINGTCGILFTPNAVWTVDRYGRKFLFIIGGIEMAVCMLAFASVGIATFKQLIYEWWYQNDYKRAACGHCSCFLVVLVYLLL
jgi:MFS family permease